MRNIFNMDRCRCPQGKLPEPTNNLSGGYQPIENKDKKLGSPPKGGSGVPQKTININLSYEVK